MSNFTPYTGFIPDDGDEPFISLSADNPLRRPCRQAIPDDDARGCDPKRLRRGGEVDFHKIHDPLIIEGAKQDHV